MTIYLAPPNVSVLAEILCYIAQAVHNLRSRSCNNLYQYCLALMLWLLRPRGLHVLPGILMTKEFICNDRFSICLLAVTAFVPLAGCGGGGSSGSSASPVVIPAATAPGAPTIGTATAGNASANISFTAPSSNGGATITGYTANCTGGGRSASGTGSASPINVAGLTNGTNYNCTFTATNSVGTSTASAAVTVTPSAAAGGTTSTASVDCPYSGTYTGSFSAAGTLTSSWSWTCNTGRRVLSANGLPDHMVGTFPGTGNPNTTSIQTIAASMTLAPVKSATNVTPGTIAIAYARNGVQFDPGTAGTCPGSATSAAQCNLANGADAWRIEALGQSVFNFGTDTSNAHVQPNGAYHYHGMPEGLLTNAGTTATNRKMTLVGWAADGYPVYGRYCYTDAGNASSAIKTCTGSYVIDSVADSGRPATSFVPLGAFTSDWSYSAGAGDLDDCNGRTGVTPEFPSGIYYYMVTDTYPSYGRCLKGTIL